MKDSDLFKRGLEIRRAVVGAEYVDKSMASADSFNMPMQELVTEYCWGAIWGRDDLSRKTRSMLNLAMISVLNRPHELKLHVAGALRNPEAAPRVFGNVLLGFALTEAVALFALVIAFMILFVF